MRAISVEFQSSVVKPKPKEFLWPIKKDGDNPVNQSKLEVINVADTKRGKMCTRELRLVEKVAREL